MKYEISNKNLYQDTLYVLGQILPDIIKYLDNRLLKIGSCREKHAEMDSLRPHLPATISKACSRSQRRTMAKIDRYQKYLSHVLEFSRSEITPVELPAKKQGSKVGMIQRGWNEPQYVREVEPAPKIKLRLSSDQVAANRYARAQGLPLPFEPIRRPVKEKTSAKGINGHEMNKRVHQMFQGQEQNKIGQTKTG